MPTDVFISYSRKDQEFVQRLATALEHLGRGAWVDWNDIRPADEFMEAIYAAIEAAENFVFVLTPDSVASVVCGREIAHAAAHNKRLVPVVLHDVDADDVPESLHDQIVKQWGYIRSYVIKDGHLFLSLMADGGIYEFEPVAKIK